MMANNDTVKKKKRDRHVGEEEVNHYQTQRIHCFSSCRAAAEGVGGSKELFLQNVLGGGRRGGGWVGGVTK